jgi:hypothetical protein
MARGASLRGLVLRWGGPVWLGVTAVVLVRVWLYASAFRPAIDDAHAYWLAAPADPYALSAMGTADAYHYSPAFLWLLIPLKTLPFDLFRPLWCALILAAVAWLVGRWLFLPSLLLPFVWADFAWGNVNAFMTVAIVLSFRWPVLWAFPVLTKVSPGIGILWFVFRREWRSLAFATGSVAAIGAIGWLFAPGQWGDWLRILVLQPGGVTDGVPAPPWGVRVIAAVILLWWGANHDARWTVPVASFAALAWWPFAFVMLLGVIRLRSWNGGIGWGRWKQPRWMHPWNR